eukprot:Nitzschia sp. Nitz4//scaffold141_size107518//76724//78222//NITZ4_004289-RA/size107518-snap-gene-0.181-mRNA-1//1//CDS//3329536327//1978//frame0
MDFRKPPGVKERKWYELVSDTVNDFIPKRRKHGELQTCQMKQDALFQTTLLFAWNQEMTWWFESNVTAYRTHRSWVLPQWDWNSLTSRVAWKLYWIEIRQRILPPTFQFFSTSVVLQGLLRFLKQISSKETMLHLTQHPPRRAMTIASRERSRVQTAIDVMIISMFANITFYTANYLVAQAATLYHYYVWRRRFQSRGASHEKEFIDELTEDSWVIFSRSFHGYVFSCVGAGVGTIVWPGTGTMLGASLGEHMAFKHPPPQDSYGIFQYIFTGVHTLAEILLRHVPSWNDSSNSKSSGKPTKEVQVRDELVCGCCQTTPFSSDPNHRERAPISSRSCDHTICKSCVQNCHLAYMERTGSYDTSVKCPLCNAPNAFSGRDLLVNRSLCAAIAAMEGSTRSLMDMTPTKLV